MTSTTPTNALSPAGTIVVVAKCPIPGKSKTRLITLLGEDGSAALAKSMLSDVLLTIDGCKALENVHKILLYAPGNEEGLVIMKEILHQLGLSLVVIQREPTLVVSTVNNDTIGNVVHENIKLELCNIWKLLPMLDGDLKSSDLGSKLEDALRMARQISQGYDGCGVVFLGMDSPILSLDDIIMGLTNASLESLHNKPQASSVSAMLCPANDGGYGMLCVPPIADPSLTFANMCWSHSLTAMSQIKALTDQKIMVTIGKLMLDVDEPSDVYLLCQQLEETNSNGDDKNLNHIHRENSSSSASGSLCERNVCSTHPQCHYTYKELKNAGLIPTSDKW
jgi:glycosyltransferase A (GT-A) superfamily protein (DUF2064 family)